MAEEARDEEADRFESDIAALRKSSLLEYRGEEPSTTESDQETRSFTLHRLVRTVTWTLADERQRRAAIETAQDFLNATLPNPDYDRDRWTAWQTLSTHLNALYSRLEETQMAAGESLSQILNQHAMWHFHRANYHVAEPLMRRALAIDEASFGTDHPNVATDLNNLALAPSHQPPGRGRAADAPCAGHRRGSYGSGPSHVAIGLNNLAHCCRPLTAWPRPSR